MTSASWPKTLLVPADAARLWGALREALLAAGLTPCGADPDVWHSRAAANEATGVWAGRDRAAKQSKGKTA